MGRAARRWRATRDARRRGDSAAFWRGLMSSIGWACVVVIILAALTYYLTHL